MALPIKYSSIKPYCFESLPMEVISEQSSGSDEDSALVDSEYRCMYDSHSDINR